MKLTIDRAVVEKLLEHAALAAQLAGHLDDPAASPLADHIDAIVHELTELLGDPHLRAVPNAVVPSAHDGMPMLTSGAGDVR